MGAAAYQQCGARREGAQAGTNRDFIVVGSRLNKNRAHPHSTFRAFRAALRRSNHWCPRGGRANATLCQSAARGGEPAKRSLRRAAACRRRANHTTRGGAAPAGAPASRPPGRASSDTEIAPRRTPARSPARGSTSTWKDSSSPLAPPARGEQHRAAAAASAGPSPTGAPPTQDWIRCPPPSACRAHVKPLTRFTTTSIRKP